MPPPGDREAAALPPDAADCQDRLSVIIPAFNEEDGIGRALEDLRRVMPRCEIIVVDDGSTDATAERASRFDGVTVIQHVFNRGYGAAIKSGMQAATREYVAWFDADNQHRAEDLAAMVGRLEHERLAVVIGQRRNPAPSALRSTGKLLMRLLARVLNVNSARDLNCGLRVFRHELLQRYLGILPDGFSASTTSTLIMSERAYPIGLHPVTLNPRIGRSKVVMADGVSALNLVLRIVMLVAPLRIFLGGGAIVVAIGSIYGLYVAFAEGGGFPTAAVVVVIFGVLLCMLGLIADQISQFRLGLFEPAKVQITPSQSRRRGPEPVRRAGGNRRRV